MSGQYQSYVSYGPFECEKIIDHIDVPHLSSATALRLGCVCTKFEYVAYAKEVKQTAEMMFQIKSNQAKGEPMLVVFRLHFESGSNETTVHLAVFTTLPWMVTKTNHIEYDDAGAFLSFSSDEPMILYQSVSEKDGRKPHLQSCIEPENVEDYSTTGKIIWRCADFHIETHISSTQARWRIVMETSCSAFERINGQNTHRLNYKDIFPGWIVEQGESLARADVGAIEVYSVSRRFSIDSLKATPELMLGSVKSESELLKDLDKLRVEVANKIETLIDQRPKSLWHYQDLYFAVTGYEKSGKSSLISTLLSAIRTHDRVPRDSDQNPEDYSRTFTNMGIHVGDKYNKKDREVKMIRASSYPGFDSTFIWHNEIVMLDFPSFNHPDFYPHDDFVAVVRSQRPQPKENLHTEPTHQQPIPTHLSASVFPSISNHPWVQVLVVTIKAKDVFRKDIGETMRALFHVNAGEITGRDLEARKVRLLPYLAPVFVITHCDELDPLVEAEPSLLLHSPKVAQAQSTLCRCLSANPSLILPIVNWGKSYDGTPIVHPAICIQALNILSAIAEASATTFKLAASRDRPSGWPIDPAQSD